MFVALSYSLEVLFDYEKKQKFFFANLLHNALHNN